MEEEKKVKGAHTRKRVSVLQNYNLYKFVEENKEAIENGSITPFMLSEKFGVHVNAVPKVYNTFGIVPPRAANITRYTALLAVTESLKAQIHTLAVAILELSADFGSKPHPGILKMLQKEQK